MDMEGETKSSTIASAAVPPSKDGRRGRTTSTGKDMIDEVTASERASERRPGHASSMAEAKAKGIDRRCAAPSIIMN